MKKNYIIPQTKTFAIQLQQLIAESPTGAKVISNTNASAGLETLSRGDNDWDEDE